MSVFTVLVCRTVELLELRSLVAGPCPPEAVPVPLVPLDDDVDVDVNADHEDEDEEEDERECDMKIVRREKSERRKAMSLGEISMKISVNNLNFSSTSRHWL